MKKIGILILLIGLVITTFTGFNFTTKEKVVDIGKLEIVKDNNHQINWSPLAGIALIIIGGGIYVIGRRQSFTSNS
ncbi:MAG: hypothetical protein ACNS60_07275 [Candidatus Cyclobacteriaceae bacterium M2_1C_046]